MQLGWRHEPQGEIVTTDLVEHLNEQRRRVNVDFYDFSIRELISMLSNAELNISPSYQRVFRWNEEAESRLIESVFLELPIPSVFAAINTDFTWELVDGLQRVSTIAHFVAQPSNVLEVIGRERSLKLSGLERLPELNGRTFGELPVELQTYFLRRTLRITALNDQTDRDARFDLFERLNRGAVRLTEQEVRACVFQGPVIDLIEELANDDEFVALTKLQKGNEKDGTREELVLKFFAYLNHQDSFRGKVAKFLTEYMKRAETSLDLREASQVFRAAVSSLFEITAGEPFLRSGVNVTPQNQFEAVLVALGQLHREEANIATPAAGWADDSELVDASTGGTNTRSMLDRRISRARDLLTGSPPDVVDS